MRQLLLDQNLLEIAVLIVQVHHQVVQVLLEEEVEINGEQWYIGHSMEYIKTAVKKQDNYSVNDIITVKAEEFLEEHTLTGEVLANE